VSYIRITPENDPPKGFAQIDNPQLASNGVDVELFPGVWLRTHLPPSNTGWKIESTRTDQDPPIEFTLYVQDQANTYHEFRIKITGPGSFDEYVDDNQPRGIKMPPDTAPKGNLTITKVQVPEGFGNGIFKFEIYDAVNMNEIYDTVTIDLSEGASKTISVFTVRKYIVREVGVGADVKVTYAVRGTPVDGDQAEVLIDHGETVTVTVTNTLITIPPTPEFFLTKKIGGTSTPTATFTFDILGQAPGTTTWVAIPPRIAITVSNGISQPKDIYGALQVLADAKYQGYRFRLVEQANDSYNTSYRYYVTGGAGHNTAFIEFWLTTDDADNILVWGNDLQIVSFEVTNTPVDIPPISLTVSSASARPGDAVVLPITASGSPSLGSLEFKVNFPAELSLTDVTLPDDSGFRLELPPILSSGLLLGLVPKGVYAVDPNGIVLNLTFKIADNAVGGAYSVSLSNMWASDENDKPMSFAVEPGNVTVKSFLYGDFTGNWFVEIGRAHV
jgi:hypothetical protein